MPLDSSPPRSFAPYDNLQQDCKLETYAGDNSVLHFMKRIKQKNQEWAGFGYIASRQQL
ncbi:hypothetical protein T12_8882 [Trichinella patagoniensis]|uniref:Uncharacterized protein n=1 Tax=Trichinella patagoniensis TaxID=990121 RepID=A0A0V0YZJ5_9BILA|nr:hypothetical protein T12_8882 [Trichinella patagoniensis]